jgi:hypothetical protein
LQSDGEVYIGQRIDEFNETNAICRIATIAKKCTCAETVYSRYQQGMGIFFE